MNDRTRYQAQAVHLARENVSAFRGVDPVTGLPVLIYRFSGTASAAISELDSDQLPRVLAWRQDDDEGLVVVAFSSAYVPAGALSVRQLADAATALAEAARHGVTHGDLGPERFLTAGDTVVLEGFGLPWTPGSSSAGDVRDWARAVMALGHPDIPGLAALLEQAAGADTALRPTPDALCAEIGQLLQPPAVEPEPVTQEPADEAAETEAEHNLWDSFAAEASPAADPFDSLGTIDFQAPGPAPEPEEEEPLTGPESAGQGVFRPSSDYASERFIRPVDSGAPVQEPEPAAAAPAGDSSGLNLPPGTTYRSSDSPAPRRTAPPPPPRRPQPEPAPGERNSRRITMLVVLVLLTVLLVAMVFLLQRREPQAAGRNSPAAQAVTYVVQVLVEPANLPPVTLHVLESPAESQLRPNTILGTAPRSIALDAAGTWVFQGRFQGRESEPVTLQIPEQRASAITVVIPPEPQEEE